MKIVLFCHSLESDWNHGNAHFLRGVCRALQDRGHRVAVYEPRDGWSRGHLLAEHGEAEIQGFRRAYPDLTSHLYDLETLDLEQALDGAELVLVHEWNPPELVRRLGEHRKRHDGYHLLFHDTHHRSVTEPASLAGGDLDGLDGYDGVLAFGAAVREIYLKRGWAERVWVWHEAADVTVFRPCPEIVPEGDLVWIGNWGDGERSAELHEFFLDPVRDLGLRADAYGVRYPAEALEALRAAGVRYRGWLPNHRVPEVFARHRFTLHVPRRPYVEKLPGIPTIRVFEALACGVPLITSPWSDSEGLFQVGRDYLLARDGGEMRHWMRSVLEDTGLAAELAAHGRATILARHTCGHRADELLAIHEELTSAPRSHPAGSLGDPKDLGEGKVRPPRSFPLAGLALRMTDPAGRSHGTGQRIAFFGSSLVSSYWNGAATYYRGLLRALAERGHAITFYEPDAFERQQHRDMPDPDWARVVVYTAAGEDGVLAALDAARGADLVVKASGVGVFDELLERETLALQGPATRVVFWDVDAPATLERMAADPQDPLRALVPRYDLVLTYGGGPKVVDAYRRLGARDCIPVYNALDPSTHHPVAPDPRFACDLAFLGNRLPDREERVKEFLGRPAAALPHRTFLLGGSGWEADSLPANVRPLGHVSTRDHNAFNCTPRAVLNVNRDSMVRFGHSPATRLFEAAGAAACMVSDAWDGIESFLEPDREILLASSGDEVAALLEALTPERARAIGQAALRRVLAKHTYRHRADQVEAILEGVAV